MSDIELLGPFGNPDGARADLAEVLDDFVDFDGNPAFGDLATRADDAKVRVVAGKLGAGKTVQFAPTGGGQTETTTTGSDGLYFIDLSPGNYEVRLSGYNPLQLYYGRSPNSYGQWPKVKVAAGRETKLDLIYDTGIR